MSTSPTLCIGHDDPTRVPELFYDVPLAPARVQRATPASKNIVAPVESQRSGVITESIAEPRKWVARHMATELDSSCHL